MSTLLEHPNIYWKSLDKSELVWLVSKLNLTQICYSLHVVRSLIFVYTFSHTAYYMIEFHHILELSGHKKRRDRGVSNTSNLKTYRVVYREEEWSCFWKDYLFCLGMHLNLVIVSFVLFLSTNLICSYFQLLITSSPITSNTSLFGCSLSFPTLLFFLALFQ